MKKYLLLLTVFLCFGGLYTPLAAQDEPDLPLAVAGPYNVGEITFTVTDENRSNRELSVVIWYPAQITDEQQADCDNNVLNVLKGDMFVCVTSDAEADVGDAPYPLVVYSHGWTGHKYEEGFINAHLASYGFVVAAMDHRCSNEPTCIIDRPLDMLFVLDELAQVEGDFAEVIDTSTVGVMGIADGGYTALALSGAQIDLDHYFHWIENGEANYKHNLLSIEESKAYRAQFSPSLEDGAPWPPFTDDRIHAILPLAPCYGPLFGERGLAVVTRPIMIMAGTEDRWCVYDHDAAYMHEHLGSEVNFLLSFIDQASGVVANSEFEAYFMHFTTAFFGYTLLEQEDHAVYLTEEYVEQFDVLAWGVYEED